MVHYFYNNRFPIIDVNQDLILREQEIKDTDAFFAYYTIPEVGQYILANKPQNIAEASAEIHYCRNLFRYHRGIYWTLARKSDDVMIGAIGLYINNQHHRAEICFDLAPEYWQKGIMTKAVEKTVNFALESIGLNRIEAVTVAENIASSSVLKKLGFTHEGTLKNYRYFEGRSHDVEMYALTKTSSIAHVESNALKSASIS